MPKATEPTTTLPPLLSGKEALAKLESSNSDAEFIRLCDAQITAYKAWLHDPEERDTHDHPEWPEYLRLDEVIRAHTPATIEGIVALARVVDMTIHDEAPESPFEVQLHRLVSLMAGIAGPAQRIRRH